ncbi:unnamed protein product [Bursaphelenchus okinawaensis]|uniref:RING-type domain-containing protein n=1 Tax=Bursaphelenchus okinawaensis TaxID=465554 RepID=A0A811K7W3_9BILA|nr:unnamed protein product [Bursaphelenchus okinawaensis]CAG9093580.1 unnamed protein product [Bursaphelenchus okinawaensis]
MYHKFSGFLSNIIRFKKPIAEENDVIINASLLSCPVCYNVYSDAPLVLPCGHTFCTDCLKQINERNTNEIGASCPICRKSFIRGKSYPKNYLVESILQSVSLVTDQDHGLTDRLKANGLKFANIRCQRQVEALSKDKSELQKQLREKETTLNTMWCCLISLGVLSLGLLFSFV